MSIQLSTAGVKVGYAVESTAGTQPTTFTNIPEIKSIPELNPEPETLETTTLAETEFKTYIAGLKDLSGALSFTANLTSDLQTAWETLVSAYTTGAGSNKATWFAIKVPGLSKTLTFKGQPSAMGMPGMEVSSVLEVNLYITPNSAPSWVTGSITIS